MSSTDQRSAEFLAVMLENAELRQALATAQDQCVELAVIAGELHGEIEALRLRLAEVEGDGAEDGPTCQGQGLRGHRKATREKRPEVLESCPAARSAHGLAGRVVHLTLEPVCNLAREENGASNLAKAQPADRRLARIGT